MFEKALRKKLRFATKRGSCDVENLWDLTVQELDWLYGSLVASQDNQKKSLLEVNQSNNDTDLAVEIVKHIVEVKLAEVDASKKRAANKAVKQRIMAIIAEKKDGELAGKSTDELMHMLDEL